MPKDYHDWGMYHFRATEYSGGKPYIILDLNGPKELDLLEEKNLSAAFDLHENIKTLEEAEKIADFLNNNIKAIMLSGPSYRLPSKF